MAGFALEYFTSPSRKIFMSFLVFFHGLWKRSLTAAILSAAILIFPTLSTAQFSKLLPASERQETARQFSNEKEISPAQLQKEIESTVQQLQGLENLQHSTPPEQLGATVDEVAEKLQLLNQKILNLNRHLDALRSIEENNKVKRELDDQVKEWKGFSQAPPYPLSLLDELRDTIDTEKVAVEKTEVEASLFREELERSRDALKIADKDLRQVGEKAEAESEENKKLRSSWLLDLAAVKSGTAETRVLSLSAQLRNVELVRQIHLSRQDFLERKLHVALSGGTVFTQEELDAHLAAISGQKKNTGREQARAVEVQENIRKALNTVRDEIDRNRETLAKKPNDKALKDQANELENRLDLLKTRAETIDLKTEMLKIWNYSLAMEKLLWEERFRVSNGDSDTDFRGIADTIGQRLERIKEFHSYLSTQLKLAQNLAMAQRSRIASEEISELERGRIARKQEVLQERVDFLLDFQPRVDDLERQVRRFRDEVTELRGRATMEERLRSLAGRFGNFLVGAWNFEIFSVEDTLIVEGQTVTQQRPVTVSKVVRALLILALGIWGATLLSGRINRLTERLFKIKHGTAVLLEKTIVILVVIFVFVFAMATVKIPLTVFAFLGGALAIGVGFGAQNIINNFISGIILLLEQPIKVGDVVEIEGTRGRVISIGGRCSQVKRFDGVDILVPNSEFLQKSVVNLTHSDELLRLNVNVGVAYGSPTRDVAKIMSVALEEHGKILNHPEPVILFEDFGDSALAFSVYFWVEQNPKTDYRIIASDFRHMLDRRFREAGITIAFPQMDVHLDSSEPLPLRMMEPVPPEKVSEKTNAVLGEPSELEPGKEEG